MTTVKRSKFIIAVTMLLIVFIVLLPSFPTTGVAFATDNHSAVLADLHSDTAFEEAKYPKISTDYSVSVIQIAEGVNGNLFIYTYQPSALVKTLVAKKINMSLSEDVNGTKLYDLTLVSSDGVFGKYEVVGYTVPASSAVRYYNISTIYRAWVNGVDTKASADKNVINSVAYPVGQLWTAKTKGDTVVYGMSEIEVVTVTEQMVGFRRYSDGFLFANTKRCDAHYLAFSCDHDIDFLISADIEFVTTDYKKLEGTGYTYSDPIPQSVTLENYQVASNDGSGWFGSKEEWHRMMSTSEFVDEVSNISDEERDILLGYDWILNFYETDYICEAGGKDILITLLVPFGFIGLIVDALTTRGTYVSEVTLLRLEFSYDGDIYNLGVVADTQTGDRNPTNGGEDANFDVVGSIASWFKNTFGSNSNFAQILKIVCIVVAAVIAIVVICMIISALKNRGGSIRIVQSSSKKKSRK